MTTTYFYRRMAALPLLLPLVAALILLLTVPLDPPVPAVLEHMAGWSMFVAYAGVVSLPPYLLYLAIVFGLWRPRTERQFFAAIWMAPFAIGFPFAAYHALTTEVTGSYTTLQLLGMHSQLPIIVGLGYAILISLLRVVAGAGGWITRTPAG